jgi:NitT/TauT family transport system permease protein
MFRTDTVLPPWLRRTLPMVAFFFLVGFYIFEAYHVRFLDATVADQATASIKLLPLPSEIWEGFKRAAFAANAKGEYRLWLDTVASMQRFFTGMAFVSLGIIIGLYMGLYPFCESLLKSFFVFLDKVPPLLLLPIIFMAFDVGELSKVMLVIIGVLPGVVLDAYGRTKEIPHDLIYKAQTLGATEGEIAWNVALPMIFPRMLSTLRLNFKAAWGYVIAGEFIAASVGIGYTVFVSKRYVAMDTIIPYVLTATFWMFAFDFILQWCEKRFRWVDK